MSNFLSPYMYGDPNFRVPPTINNPNYMSPIIPFLPAIVGAFNGAVGAYGSAQQQRRAIANQWQMFEAQIKHQNAVNERAMAFQREMNQRNEEWNNESNVRQRIEDAGYNPYLYQNGAMSANVNQSTPLAQNVAPTSPVELSNPFATFATSAIDSVKGVADILKSRQETKNIVSQTAATEYSLKRQKGKDEYVIGGQTLPKTEAMQAYYEVEKAANIAIQEQVNAALATLRESVYQAPAVDENDQPITDETGRQLSMYEASGRSELKANMKQLDKLFAEIENVKSVTDLNKVKKKLESFNLDYLAPAQVAQVYQTIEEIRSHIKQIKVSTDLIGEQTTTERVKRTGEVIRNGYNAKLYDDYDSDKWWRRGLQGVQPLLNGLGMALKR
ncbi:hypothetical protein HMPREF2137_05685 [Hoylesella buccalis DNF00853]|uniref:Uncharacterized protein n=2 Tax=Hoylesella buccalis TaxID=28127 RepID=A0A095ZJK3_9BACT|nr:hypothetical protein HMPREF2137_05685 [Hoylesella buccalis DNF00853]